MSTEPFKLAREKGTGHAPHTWPDPEARKLGRPTLKLKDRSTDQVVPFIAACLLKSLRFWRQRLDERDSKAYRSEDAIRSSPWIIGETLPSCLPDEELGS